MGKTSTASPSASGKPPESTRWGQLESSRDIGREPGPPGPRYAGFWMLVEAGWSQGKGPTAGGPLKASRFSKRLKAADPVHRSAGPGSGGRLSPLEYAYQIRRLADRKVKPKKLIALAKKPVTAEIELHEAASGERTASRAKELRAGGCQGGHRHAVVGRRRRDRIWQTVGQDGLNAIGT